MFRYTFNNGDIMTTKLPKEEVMHRLNRLDTLRVLTEGYDEGEGRRICQKAWTAYNKLDGFTGIIRLTRLEKDWLSYLLESDMLDDDDISVINYYLRF